MFFKKKPTFDWLVAGLGNPGLQYENSRHNAGFMAIDRFMKAQNGEFLKHKMNSVLGECRINDNRILAIKPQTFMNNSGQAVSDVAKYYKIPTERIIILCDDVNLDIGKIRIRRKGSDGGQKGMRDIIELLGTEEIYRIKIGIGQKPNPEYDLADWVLSKFPKESKNDLELALDKTAKAIKEIITRGIDSAMNKYTG